VPSWRIQAVFFAQFRAWRYDSCSSRNTTVVKYLYRLFPCVLLSCNLGAAVCCAVNGDYRRSVYWAASALCIGAVAF